MRRKSFGIMSSILNKKKAEDITGKKEDCKDNHNSVLDDSNIERIQSCIQNPAKHHWFLAVN